MNSQALLRRRGGLWGETEVILTKQPDAATLAVVLGVENPQRSGLKLFSTAVTAWLNHLRPRAKRMLIKTTVAE